MEKIGGGVWILYEREFIKGLVDELGGDFREAVNQYLLDAEKCRQKGRGLYASISYASAARCMKILGDYGAAARYYLMAANELEALLGQRDGSNLFIREKVSRYVYEALKLLTELSERD